MMIIMHLQNKVVCYQGQNFIICVVVYAGKISPIYRGFTYIEVNKSL